MSYSQNKEDLVVLDYFNGYKGKLLDIGANDGVTFSNSKLLIDQGWQGTLLEPSPRAFERLVSVYDAHLMVYAHNFGIGTASGYQTIYESGCHIKGGNDIALVSSIHESELERWPGVRFDRKMAMFHTFKECRQTYPHFDKFDFITIDCEGCDWDILQQIDLADVGCRCLCIEWNSDVSSKARYTNYVHQYGLKLIHENAENLLFAI